MKNDNLQEINQDPELGNPVAPLIGEVINERDNEISEVENYTPNEFDVQINEYDTLTYFEELSSFDYTFPVEDLSFELHYELTQKIKQIRSCANSPTQETFYAVHLLESWQNILEDLRGFFTSQHLYALDYCIGTYASVCTSPYERRKEIRRNLYYLKNRLEADLINCDELEYIIGGIDPLILYELTEIILNSDIIHHCTIDPENSFGYSLLENDFLMPSTSKQEDEEKKYNDAKKEHAKEDFEFRLKLKLENLDKSDDKLQKLQEKLNKTDNYEERMQILNDYRNASENQKPEVESLSMIEFANKYREYMTDIRDMYFYPKSYISQLISDDNILYINDLYSKYIEVAFDDFIQEFKKCYYDPTLSRKYLLSFYEFEKCLYYHAYRLCSHKGKVSPTYDDVNKMISTRPYGDRNKFSQSQIKEIVGFPRDSEHNLCRDYCCELAINQCNLIKEPSKKSVFKSQPQENDLKSKIMTEGE
jgi:hypothetical protein